MRTVILLAAAVTAIALAPSAHAEPGCGDSSDPTCGGHSWNGPLRDTWDNGYYGGHNGGNDLLCSPFDYKCAGRVPRNAVARTAYNPLR